ncbi:hypothetical protein [Thermophilibacter mediterraneus]|uniref:hypothetical protein n=1 Tax=Thermophilibacter mediterraneus TaxID=1871031 RepID=UPI00093114BA|nr:hypothetical protein [Thermophilibacter mediterraneus]
MKNDNATIIRLHQSFKQQIGHITRVIGLMSPKFLVGLIDKLDLDANPRNSRLGNVTNAIQESIEKDEEAKGDSKLFPLKSKGILIAASGYEVLDRNRYMLEFVDRSTEGILDGGHNTLAIGAYILAQAAKCAGTPTPTHRAMAIWDDFKSVWGERRDEVDAYIRAIKEDPNGLVEHGAGKLDFLVPVELILPADPNDELCLEEFRSSLLEICDARNNNAQLTQGTKGNQEGLFDSFKTLFGQKYPEFAKQISWKTNDGGSIQSRSLVALAWIVLSKTKYVQDGNDKILDAPAASSIYSGKEKCLEKYLHLLRDDRVSNLYGQKRELKDPQVASALKVATDLPLLYDRIYRIFPDCYNTIGTYGRIGAVKSLMNKTNDYKTPFFHEKAEKPVPDGFIYPLVYGLRAIIDIDESTGEITWKTDPYQFVESDAFRLAVAQYCGVIQQSDYDPQKVGKGAFSYTSAENAVKLAYLMTK